MIKTKQKPLDSIYPTKEKILSNLPPNNKEIIELLKGWMAATWQQAKKEGEEAKFLALKELIQSIAVYFKQPVKVEYRPSIDSCCYVPLTKTIFINNSLSIISSLHELGHHLFGTSEYEACRWSVSLFKAAFPKAYDKLEWKGHLLIKKG